MVSISSGTLDVEGNRARYEVRMPWYEVEYMENPQADLFRSFHLRRGSEEAPGRDIACRHDRADDLYVCQDGFEFPDEITALEVECTFYAVTIPNHVHILKARRGETTDEAVFDLTATRAELNFIPPTWWDLLAREGGAGARRAVAGLASLLFLVAMVIAGRTDREFAALVLMFLAGQALSCLLLPVVGWRPAPRFVEAAAALTIAYLAVEVLLLPQAGQRWVVVGVLGLFHGLYLALFLRESAFVAWRVLGGAMFADLLALGLLGLAWRRLRAPAAALRVVPVTAALLLAFGLGWFFWRLDW